MSGTLIVLFMTFLFLFFGYLGVPVAFSLLAGTLIGAMFTDVSQTAIIQKMFDGMDNEALLAIPFFLLVGELMSSANVVQRVANLSLSLVGHIRGGLSRHQFQPFPVGPDGDSDSGRSRRRRDRG